MRKYLSCGAATAMMLAMTCNLFGQAASGTIVGTVTDQAGAVVGGASVSLLNEGTGFTRTVTANQSGQYAAEFFPLGRVRITVEQPGFQKLIRAGAELTAADRLTVDLQMQVGNVQQTVEVTDTAPVLQTQSQAISSLMTNQQIVEIPLNQRIFTQLIQLMPGATSSTPNPQAGGTYGLLASNSFAVNGSQSSKQQLSHRRAL